MADDLARLIAEQARDDATDRLRHDGRMARETDLKAIARRRAGGEGRFDLRDFAADRRPSPSKFQGRSRRVAIRSDSGDWHDTSASGRRAGFAVLLIGCTPWEAAVQFEVMAGRCECPVCHDAIRSESHYCTYCDRSGLDQAAASGHFEFFGIEPDSVLNPIAEAFELDRARERRKAREQEQRGRTIRGGIG